MALEHIFENGFTLPQNGTPTDPETAKLFRKDWAQELLQKPAVLNNVKEYLRDSKERCENFLLFVETRQHGLLEA